MNKFDSTRKRKHRITIRLNDDEYRDLCEWSTACRMSMNDYLRELIQGFQPVAFPPLEYKEVIDELRRIGVNMNQIASKAHSLGFVDDREYQANADRIWRCVASLSEQLVRGGVKFGYNEDMGGQRKTPTTD